VMRKRRVTGATRRWWASAARCTALVLLVSVVLGPRAAHGQTPATVTPAADARTLFERGVAALQQDAYAEALDSFEQSYRLEPRVIVLYNIGMCQWELRNLVPARDALQGYLTEAGENAPAEVRASAEHVLGEIERMTCALAIQVSEPAARILLDGAEVGTSPSVELATLPPGTYVVEAQLQGFENARATVALEAGEAMTVSLTLTRTGVRPGAEGNLSPDGSDPTDGGGGILSNGWFWTSIAVTGGATVAAIVTGSLGLQAHDDYEAGGARDADLRDMTVSLGLATDILIGVAAAGVVGALVAYFTMDEPEETDAGPVPAEVAVLPGRLVVTW
jgi:hypothetical protein